jgi:hypothetical protein
MASGDTGALGALLGVAEGEGMVEFSDAWLSPLEHPAISTVSSSAAPHAPGRSA